MPPPAPEATSVSGSGVASANNGAVANSGVMGPVTVEHHHHPQAAAPTAWPVLVGRPPALASAFQPREVLRDRIVGERGRGADVILTQQDGRSVGRGTRVLAGGGGVGKSQLAAWFAHQAFKQGIDLVVWVNATTVDQVITTYARAAARVGAPGADGTDPDADAQSLLEWLHTTSRSWLIVLDDVTDPATLADWWPPRQPAGWTLATTRLRDATLVSGGRQQVEVDVYAPDESIDYLTDRIGQAQCSHLVDENAGGLADAVGHLPLALSHAAAYMINQEETCTNYLARYTDTETRLADLMPAGADPDGYGRAVAVTLLLALDAADSSDPVGLARPALALAAMLDPAGHPDSLWGTPATIGYLGVHRTGGIGKPVTADQARKAVRLLHRYGLLTHTPTDGARAVRIHALTARATRETLADLTAVSYTAADALLDLWPEADHTAPDLVAALHVNTSVLTAIAGDLLWQPDRHPLLYQAGTSLLRAGQHTAAVTHWQHLAGHATQLLGEEHPNTLTARGNLAVAYDRAGRSAEAISLHERVVADRERLLGGEHSDTLAARGNLATSYRLAGRIAEATILLERVAVGFTRLFGHDHPHTLTTRGYLATSYRHAGRAIDAIRIEEQVAAGWERLLGDDHPHTLTARAHLASSYGRAGRITEAINIEERVLADRERILGEQHPDTLIARVNLAASYGQAGRTREAISLQERVAADSTRLLGNQHPHTLTARANLAASYGRTKRTGEAISMLEQVAADRARLLGEKHPDTIAAVDSLRGWRRDAGSYE
ncbi:tetratricopeptide repeat protein [Frankia gtarii]|uniref:tetratricopeptide repeat protein n=1 Tax=Frankia gtarii TaxID=2950102 RepID=UPI0021BFC1C1|nr:tetratricopeptide repeat protein [Frankia gtarii]